MLLSSNLLVHFDPSLELTLACDASPYGVGAVLAHRTADGVEKPIGFVSRDINQCRKELLPIRKRRTCMYIWTQEIPFLFIWIPIHDLY